MLRSQTPILDLNRGSLMNKQQIWKPSILDETCHRMIISTSWVYRIHLVEQRLRDSIQKLLSIYPKLGGRVNNDNVIFPSGDIHFEYLHRKGSAENLIEKIHCLRNMKPSLI